MKIFTKIFPFIIMSPPLHNPYAKTKKRSLIIHNPYAKKATTKMAKQDETTNNSQPSSWSCAPGFYLPDEEMVFNEQDDKDAIEWAKSTGLIDRQLTTGLINCQDATGLIALQVQDAVALPPIAQPGVPKRLVSEPSETYKEYKSGISKVTACIRKIVKKEWFPKVNSSGCVYRCPEGQSGKKAQINSVDLSEHEVRVLIQEKFPCYPLVDIPNASVRALQVKGGSSWTEESIWCARECFYVPSGTKLLVLFPDVFNRDLLRKHPKFIKKNLDGTQGIMTPCPYCKTNKRVSFSSFNVQKWGRPPRHSMHTDARRLHLCSVIYSCDSPNCVGPLPKPGSKQAEKWDPVPASCVPHTFSIWLKDCFDQYPPEVQRRYLQHANGLGVNADFINLATSALTREILDDRNTYKSIQDSLERH
jgi:hypothetical protein